MSASVATLNPPDRRRGPAFAAEADKALGLALDVRRTLRRASRSGYASDYLCASIAAVQLLRAAADLHGLCAGERDRRRLEAEDAA